MEILIRRATVADVPTIMDIMTAAHQAMKDPSAYITDDAAYVAEQVQGDGFSLLAHVEGKAAGFFLVCIPGLAENNLGRYLNFSERRLRRVALMDSVAVLPAFQGIGLMEQMLREAVRLTEAQYSCLLGTVAPDNHASRRSFEKCGFSTLKRIRKPCGLERLLMGRPRSDGLEEGAMAGTQNARCRLENG